MNNNFPVKKLSELTSKIIDGTHFTPKYKNNGVPFLRVTDVQRKIIDKNKIKYISKEEHSELTKRCKPSYGDILYSKNGTIGIPKIVDWKWDFSIFVSLALIKPNHKIDKNYLYHILGSEFIKSQIKKRAKQGTVTNLHLEEIREFEIPFPPLSIQTKIAAILTTSDEVFEQTYALIEKYKNIKKGMLHDLFTRGIDPLTKKLRPTKELAPELYHETKLGWIPKGWLCNPIEETANLIISNVDKKSFNNEIPVLLCNYMDVYNNNFITDELHYMSATATLIEINKFQLIKDDVLFTKDSETPEDIAVPSVVKQTLPNLICGYHLGILRPLKLKTNGVFLMYLLQSENIKRQFIRVANGSTRYGLTKDSINNILIPSPGFTEQNLIAERLVSIDVKIEKEQIYLDKMQSIKQGLMQDLLTGNVPV